MGKLAKKKAAIMLKEGRARGKKLTTKQKKYFGWVSGGSKNPKKKHK